MTARLFSQNTKDRIQNTGHGTQNTEHGTQNTEHRTQNTEHGTRNTEHRTRKLSKKKPAGLGAGFITRVLDNYLDRPRIDGN